MNPRIRRRTGLAAAIAGPLAFGACAREPEPAPDHVSQAEIDEAMHTPTELDFWTWVPGIEKQVALFQEAYPDIKVDVTNSGQGAGHYAKLRTALRAGRGAPDVAQLEYQMVPAFSITDHLLDLRPYGAGDLEDQFVAWVWAQVSGVDGEVWAIPQDTGPMGMLYRADIFEEHGIAVPETWEAFAEAARALHEADPEVYLTNFAPSQGAFFSGALWQAGGDPFGGSAGEDLRVDLTSEQARRVTEYWSGLAAEGVVSTDPDFSDQWYQALNRGKYATWITAAWGPVFLQSTAASTSGKWRAAPMPQWEAGDAVSGNWGGSTSAVFAVSENRIAAAVFAQFINTDPESTMTMATEQFLFPPTKALLEDPAFTGQEPEFYGGQRVNEVFAQISDTVSPDFQWPPFQDQVYADYSDTVGTAIAEGGDALGALDQWQSRVTEYAELQGFTVEES
ncbi:ABC transporter substrate-binding protein [Glycomyces harbinensis]|uniref:Multiple sugar transport system substrate-binding protein n=1 Tax=Glycomyces harbinensis TaxID=58114 RepID=A0A1G7AHH9_9ACTN|nr:sugar ABC transporter substrate-binding protein [Glycomyces harbinensis]SDE14163.1 multiple sugar transport system substrate-binding protein [Glycomyces harbinensis]